MKISKISLAILILICAVGIALAAELPELKNELVKTDDTQYVIELDKFNKLNNLEPIDPSILDD